MRFRRFVAQLDLTAVLLFLVAVELVLNRLAVPVLRPQGVRVPPHWHQNLDRVGLFFFHLASALALGVVAHEVYRRVIHPGAIAVRGLLAATGVVFLACAGWAVLTQSSADAAFVLEASFLAFIVAGAVFLFASRAPWTLAIGYLILLLPFLLHFVGTFKLHVLTDPEAAQWSNLPDRVRNLGQHAVALAAIMAPLLLGPRPMINALTRPGPMVLSAFVASISALILRRHYEVGMELSSRGLGMELGPGAPPETMAVYVSAAAAAVWTVASCLVADSAARRRIGLGFALIIVGGYGFSWPLQYLCAAGGLLAIAEAGLDVKAEEQAQTDSRVRFHAPPIADDVWQAYLRRLGEALSATPVGAGSERHDDTVLRGEHAGRPFVLTLSRVNGSLESIGLAYGASAPETPPAWTLLARSEGGGGHAPPPGGTIGPAARTGDAGFDRRFRVHDTAAHTTALFDEGLRARAAASLDGWLALWPGRRLEYRVYPGRGAPLDHPVPITELSFRAPHEPPVDRLVSLVHLVGELAARAELRTGAPRQPA